MNEKNVNEKNGKSGIMGALYDFMPFSGLSFFMLVTLGTYTIVNHFQTQRTEMLLNDGRQAHVAIRANSAYAEPTTRILIMDIDPRDNLINTLYRDEQSDGTLDSVIETLVDTVEVRAYGRGTGRFLYPHYQRSRAIAEADSSMYQEILDRLREMSFSTSK